MEETAAEVRRRGAVATTHVADVASRDRMRTLPDEVARAHDGALHILVNNAGVTVGGTFAEHSLEDWDRVMGVNFWGVVHGVRFFLPHLAAADEAHIVNISSIFGVLGVPAQSSYCASKFAVRGLSESLWEELRHSSVGLTVVHPGAIATNIAAAAKTYHPVATERLVSFFAESGLSPETAAARIVDAVRRGRRRVLIGLDAHVGDLVKRLLPTLGNRLVAKLLMGRVAFDPARANVVAPNL